MKNLGDFYMIKIAILDDRKEAADNIASILGQIYLPPHTLNIFTNTASLMNSAAEEAFDIIFLDIVLGNENGIELAKKLTTTHSEINIIFISAYPEYHSDVYAARHIYFLTKPVNLEHMKKAVEIALDNINCNYVLLPKNKSQIRISKSSVVYAEGELKKSTLYFNDDTSEGFNIPLAQLESLLNDRRFLRIHQSFIVNMEYITQFRKGAVTLSSGKKLMVTRKYSATANDAMTRFLGGI